MSRETNVAVIVAVIVVGALALLAGRSTYIETEVLPSVTLGDPQDVEPNAAVITGKHQTGGFSIAGLRFGHTTYRISVQFFAGPGCHELVDHGEPWPTPYQDCASAVPITGSISGLGNTGTGESIIGVDVEVAEDCYKAVALGENWPPPAPPCSPDG